VCSVSSNIHKILGYNTEEWKSTGFLSLIHPDDIDRIIKEVDLNNSSCKHALDLFYRIRKKNGVYTWVYCIVKIERYEQGTPMQIVVYVFEQTNLKNSIIKIKDFEHKMVNKIVQVQESERAKFSRELHDGLGPLLASIKLYFQWLAETNDEKKTKLITERGLYNIEKAIETLGEISRGMNPTQIENEGFINSLKKYVNDLNSIGTVKISLTTNLPSRFNKVLEITLFRVALELINNTLKHAQATEINIDCSLIPERNQISFTYEDNGIGFDKDKIYNQRKGLGLRNIQSRALSLGGMLTIESRIGYGTKVVIELPLSVPHL
jgi:signal transduction histidine kinase